MEKTVYFLGSGFSKEAGGLVQNEIIKTLLDEDFTRGNERLIKAKDNFIGFLMEELHIYEDHYCIAFYQICPEHADGTTEPDSDRAGADPDFFHYGTYHYQNQ